MELAHHGLEPLTQGGEAEPPSPLLPAHTRAPPAGPGRAVGSGSCSRRAPRTAGDQLLSLKSSKRPPHAPASGVCPPVGRTPLLPSLRLRPEDRPACGGDTAASCVDSTGCGTKGAAPGGDDAATGPARPASSPFGSRPPRVCAPRPSITHLFAPSRPPAPAHQLLWSQ